MKIKGVSFEVTSSYLILRLRDPYWSAYVRFNWPEGTPGFSVNKEAINTAIELKKKILVKNKYGDYEISPFRALKYGSPMSASNGTELICIPKTAFKKLPELQEEIGGLNVMNKLVETPQWEKLRAKLHE